MGLLDNYTGLGMSPRPTKEHQTAIMLLIVALFHCLDEKKYLVLPESCLNLKDLNSKAPDVVVYNKKDLPIVFIEVTNTKMLNSIIKESQKVLTEYNSIEEAFVYDYQKNIWYRIYPDYQKVSSNSLTLEIAFAEFFE